MVYGIKQRFPLVFRFMDSSSRFFTSVRHRKRRNGALQESCIGGKANGKDASIRKLSLSDTELLAEFLHSVPEEHVQFFHPHGFSKCEIEKVLNSSAFCCYGLFMEDEIVAYALIKLFPTRNAYIGRLVSPTLTGLGIGKFLSRYLCWQAYLMRVVPGATIHKENMASLRSAQSVRKVEIREELTGGYMRLSYPVMDSDKSKPELNL